MWAGLRARRTTDATVAARWWTTAGALAGVALLVSMAFHSGAFAVVLALTAWVAGSWVKALAAAG